MKLFLEGTSSGFFLNFFLLFFNGDQDHFVLNDVGLGVPGCMWEADHFSACVHTRPPHPHGNSSAYKAVLFVQQKHDLLANFGQFVFLEANMKNMYLLIHSRKVFFLIFKVEKQTVYPNMLQGVELKTFSLV